MRKLGKWIAIVGACLTTLVGLVGWTILGFQVHVLCGVFSILMSITIVGVMILVLGELKS